MKVTFLQLLGAIAIAGIIPAAANSATLSYTQNQTTISYPVNWNKGITVEKAMQTVGPDYVTGWSHKYRGNSLLMVLSTGTFPTTPTSTNGKLGTPYWLLCIDGSPASKSMSQQTIPSTASKVNWIWTSQYKCN